MILRFKLLSIAGAAAVLSAPASEAFAPAVAVKSTTWRTAAGTSTARAGINPDWDNGDFLASLSGGQQDIDDANDKYYRQSDNRAQMNAWRAKQAKGPSLELLQKMGLKFGMEDNDQQAPEPTEQQQSNPQQSGPSGEFFKKMGLRDDRSPPPMRQPQLDAPEFSQQQAPPQQMQPPQQQIQPTQQAQPPPQMSTPQQQEQVQPPPQQQLYDANGNPIQMFYVYDANGNLVPFNPMQQQLAQPQPPPEPQQMQQPPAQPEQQQLQQQMNPVPDFSTPIVEPPLPQKTKGTDSPRPVGYNPDAYTMANTADVYFAQLKQDSKVRKIARMSGDLETANQVFADDSIKEIGDSWTDNPYTREKNLAEARAEVEATVRMENAGWDAEEASGSSSTGMSYREKLAQMQAKRAAGGGM